MVNKRALGRGLNTLLPTRPQTPPSAPTPTPELPVGSAPTKLSLDDIVPNPFQPRRHFDGQALAELAQSIKSDGIIQPLVVRKHGGHFELIAGERRWRAARIAGLDAVPVYVQDTPDDRMLEVALVENIQREDLNPMETAIAFERLNDELGLNHEEIGVRTGKDRATVSNFIRLLQLPDEVQQMIATRKISPGHARPLLRLTSASEIIKLAEQIVANDWSVRQVEKLLSAPAKVEKQTKTAEKAIDPNVRAAIEDLERALGTRVRIIERTRGRGRIEIDYFSQDDLDRVYSAIIPDQAL